MEEHKLNNKGFTLIELLIGMILVMIVMLGLLRGILEYNKFSIRAKMKDKATEIAQQWSSYIESLLYNDSFIDPNFGSITCGSTVTLPDEFYNKDNYEATDTYEGYSGKEIHAGRIVALCDSQPAKVISIMVWYDEPFTDKLQAIQTTVIKYSQ